MIDILVVDDSEVEQRLAAGLLRKNSEYRVRFAANGREALAAMGERQPSLVVTDLVMPEMDGLELVRSIRRDHPEVPVVLMTAYGNESIAVTSLEEGAASYVPKACQSEQLLDTVARVLARTEADRHRERLMGCLSQTESSFLLESDPALITALVNLVQNMATSIGLCDATWRIRLGVALEEALLNALYHGNLEMGTEEWAHARAEHAAEGGAEEFEQRRTQSPYRDRKITVQFNLSRFGARFVIGDGGPGFDVVAASGTSLADRLERGGGRGMVLIRKLMDRVTYNDAGNEVTLFKRCESVVTTSPSAHADHTAGESAPPSAAPAGSAGLN